MNSMDVENIFLLKYNTLKTDKIRIHILFHEKRFSEHLWAFLGTYSINNT